MNDSPDTGQESPQDAGDPARRQSPGKTGHWAGTPGDISSTVPIPYRILALEQEKNRLFSIPADVLYTGIKAAGFSCTLCGACCTRAVNRHVFLLDRDVKAVRAIDPGACVPAPDPEFCDGNGTLYDSGYALVMDGGGGACRFLKNNRCRIYDRRFSICRIYPHMLRRESGGQGWCTFARKNEHGTYGADLPDDACRDLAREVLMYEHAFLSQQIAFLETVQEHFGASGLCHDAGQQKRSMKRLQEGLPVQVKVFHAGKMEDWKPDNKPAGARLALRS